MATAKGTIALMGSGEFTATMVEAHKELLARVGPSPRAVFLDTPAGFQLNVDQISRKAAQYFRERVGHPLEIASLPCPATASPYDAELAYRTVRRADFVLMGPGSPSYALRQWRRTPIPEILGERVAAGGCLVAASAAALTVGRRTLPVYEIYKVGEDPHWLDGMDLLGRFDLPLVVVPHWNNAEGGTHDTRFCYMGEARFRDLEARLGESEAVLGLDEHTACLLDLERDEAEVRGIGRVTYRHRRGEERFEKGDRIPLSLLRGEAPKAARPRAGAEARAPAPAAPPDDPFWSTVHGLDARFQGGLEADDPRAATNALLELDRFLWQAQQDLQDEGSLTEAREALREMIVLLGARLAERPEGPEQSLAPVVEALLELRDAFRRERKWDEADAIRERLQDAGVAVEDTREGSRWQRNP